MKKFCKEKLHNHKILKDTLWGVFNLTQCNVVAELRLSVISKRCSCTSTAEWYSKDMACSRWPLQHAQKYGRNALLLQWLYVSVPAVQPVIWNLLQTKVLVDDNNTTYMLYIFHDKAPVLWGRRTCIWIIYVLKQWQLVVGEQATWYWHWIEIHESYFIIN